jgi:hypothetical protein
MTNSTPSAAKQPSGPEITETSVSLWRQVFPNEAFVRDGRTTSAAFTPKQNDQGLLSVSDSRKATAQEAYTRYIGRGLRSDGVWAVTVGECQTTSLKCFEDPIPDDDTHAAIDFRNLSGSQIKQKARILSTRANERGRIPLEAHTPPPTPGFDDVNDTDIPF